MSWKKSLEEYYKGDKMRQRICIISGPTAIGKSDLSIQVAKSLNGEIISADSAQVYKYLNIGTAKLSEEEMQGIKHYMIDEVYPNEKFSVALYRKKAKNYIEKIHAKNKLPIIVGGTGLYIKSLLDNLDFTDSIVDENYRKHIDNLAKTLGNKYIHDKLKDIDPISYKKLHPNDIRRITRALEVYKHTGRPISYFQIESRKKPCQYDFAYICLNAKRETIYKRIDLRVDKMIDMGLISEVENLLSLGYGKDLVAMQALGYKEIICYIEGIMSKTEAIDLLKRNTRRYAKRQLTWFRADPRVFWINIEGYVYPKDIIENIIRFFAGKINLI